MAKDRFWEASMAPTYVGNSADCGLTIGERATLDMARSIIIAKPEYIDAPEKLAEISVTLAKAVLKRCWKEKG